MRTLICIAVGVILTTAHVNVVNNWQAWAVIFLVAIQGIKLSDFK